LAWANRERGTDSLGFFDSSGKMIKAAVDPDEALAQENITNWLDISENGGEKRPASWFIAGHTRQATRGAVNRQNSHPFRYGKVIGCHNGMVDAPKGYTVDSQYLFDTLHKAAGDYNKAWESVSGYWGIAWFDGEAFYLQSHNGDVHVGLKNGVWYYSSSKAHLAACIGHNSSIKKLSEGQTLRFLLQDGVVIMEEVAKFESTAPEYWSRKYGCSNANYDYDYTGGFTRRHGKAKRVYYEDDATTTGVKDMDSEWRSAWEAYATDSEHSRVD
jgi:hypothetical protein